MDGMMVTTKRAQVVRRIEQVRNTWGHDISDGVDWTEALCREYWHSALEKFLPGDRVEIHSFDHRIQFTMLVLDVNAQSDPLYFDAAFLPVYPPDLRLPELPPQRVPRYQVRQAPGSSLFNVVDNSTGKPVHENPKTHHAANEMCSELERGLAVTTGQIADALARVEAATDPAPDRREKARERTRRWREQQRAAAEAAAAAATQGGEAA